MKLPSDNIANNKYKRVCIYICKCVRKYTDRYTHLYCFHLILRHKYINFTIISVTSINDIDVYVPLQIYFFIINELLQLLGKFIGEYERFAYPFFRTNNYYVTHTQYSSSFMCHVTEGPRSRLPTASYHIQLQPMFIPLISLSETVCYKIIEQSSTCLCISRAWVIKSLYNILSSEALSDVCFFNTPIGGVMDSGSE